MPLIIKEINVKVNVEDNGNKAQSTKEMIISDEEIEKIVEECTKNVLKRIRNKQLR